MTVPNWMKVGWRDNAGNLRIVLSAHTRTSLSHFNPESYHQDGERWYGLMPPDFSFAGKE